MANPHQQKPSTWSQIWAFAQWNRTWTFAQDLLEHFGVRHLLLGPPRLATLPDEQVSRLNSNLTYNPAGFTRWQYDHGWKRVTFPPPYHLTTSYHGEAGTRIVPARWQYVTVQAVRACPWPACIIVGCDNEKLARFEKADERLEGFIAHARNKRMQLQTTFPWKHQNKTQLVQGLKRSFALVAATVEAHPCLKEDFQVYLRSDGSVFNVDLDRCFDRNRSLAASLSNSIELGMTPNWPTAFCRRVTDQRRFDKALETFYERLSR